MKNIKEKNNIVGLKELRNNTESYIRRLTKGQSFTVVRRSHQVFKLVPVDGDDESLWTDAIDFTKMKGGGMPMKEFARILQKINAKN